MTKKHKKVKRKVDFLVLSDIHLGTYGCHSKELLKYLNSIKPKVIVLNGDIIDMWQFSKRYWPKSHMQVIHKIMNWVNKGVKVYYITGNHDEMLRKFAGNKIGSLVIDNKLVVELDGQQVWIFHGDVFDVTMQHSKWLAKLGSHGYDFLILLNAFCNWVSVKLGREKISLSKTIKNSVKKAVKFINDFEKTAADIAISKGYDYVICGHIHHPEIKLIETDEGEVMYMNSGDWVENLTALEYHNQQWKLFRYNEKDFEQDEEEGEDELATLDNHQIFTKMLDGFMETTTGKKLKTKP
jgi:UDP-2,3-diacylglucosamine pyrophosphatase LpxH